MNISRIVFLLVLLFPSTFMLHAEPDSRSPESVLAFADWLFKEQEYVRAAGEYYRAFFYAPEGEKTALLRKIGLCYFRAGEYRQVIGVYEKLFHEYPNSPFLEDAYYESAYSFFKLGEFDNASRVIDLYSQTNTLLPPFLLLDGANLLLAGEWDKAAVLLNQYLLDLSVPDATIARRLIALTEEIKSTPTRSPWLAGLFSAIIPGTGKLYAGRVEDGVASLIICGFFGGMAAYGFATEGVESVKGWLYASISGLFYLGDIWGSVVAALQFNSEQRERIKREVKERVDRLFP